MARLAAHLAIVCLRHPALAIARAQSVFMSSLNSHTRCSGLAVGPDDHGMAVRQGLSTVERKLVVWTIVSRSMMRFISLLRLLA